MLAPTCRAPAASRDRPPVKDGWGSPIGHVEAIDWLRSLVLRQTRVLVSQHLHECPYSEYPLARTEGCGDDRRLTPTPGGLPLLFFVIGTGRCGLTEVAELLARHPDVGFVSNLDDKLSRLEQPPVPQGRYPASRGCCPSVTGASLSNGAPQDRRCAGGGDRAGAAGGRAHGFATDVWTLDRIAVVIQGLTRVALSNP